MNEEDISQHNSLSESGEVKIRSHDELNFYYTENIIVTDFDS